MRHYRPFQNKWYCITHLCIWSSEAGCACDIWSSAMSKIFLVISALGVCVLHSNRCFAETTDKVYNKNMLQAALITFINICLNQKTPDLHSDYWLRFISWVHLRYHTVQDFLFLMWIHVFPISAWASDICLTHSWLTRFSSCCCQLCNFVTKESVTFHTSVHFFSFVFLYFWSPAQVRVAALSPRARSVSSITWFLHMCNTETLHEEGEK